MRPVRLFISYAHDDIEHLKELRAQLGGLEMDGRIVVFDDGEIKAGTKWDSTIKAELRRADLILLMLSPSFLDSRYARHIEYGEALERWRQDKVVVYPIVVRAIDLGALKISEIQARPHDKMRRLKPLAAWSGHRRTEVLASIAAELRELVAEIAARDPGSGQRAPVPHAAQTSIVPGTNAPSTVPTLECWRDFPNWDDDAKIRFLVAHFPGGPRVAEALMPADLEERAQSSIPCDAAIAIIREANRLIALTNPKIPIRALGLVSLPDCHTRGEHAYWAQAFNMAMNKGPRMLATLVLVVLTKQPGSLHGADTKIEKLIQGLKGE